MMIGYAILVLCFCGCLSSEVPSWGPERQPSRTFNQVLDRLTREDSIELSRGVNFVKVNETRNVITGRSDSILNRLKRFFRSYELRLKLLDIFQKKQDVIKTLRKALSILNGLDDGNEERSRGKGHGLKKGGGPILMMASLMAGTMATLGFGALGMLVMKALTVSAMALLLSVVLGLRRLFPALDDGFGGRISYVPVHAEHIRRRRNLPDLPYRAYPRRR